MAGRTRISDHLTLRRASRLSVWGQIGVRLGLVFALLGFVIAVHWLERESLKDNLDNHVSFIDVIYFTMISGTTTGYGDIVPVTDRARMFDALVVTPIRIFFVLIFVGTAYQLVLRRSLERWRMARLQERLSGHIIIAGYGTSGAEALDELLARGVPPDQVVVVDCNEAALEQAEALGCMVLGGDATRDKTLEAVRIGSARSMIVSAGRDDTSILITLTARHLAPALAISIAVRNEDNELIARQAGATTVINPVSFAGLLLAGSTHGQHIADYMADLASHHGRVRLHEWTVEPQHVGRSLQEAALGLGLRIYRNGLPFGFWEPEVQALQAGDCIVEVLPTQRAERDLT